MRIALACAYAWDAPGGVQTHVRQLARHLRAAGHDVLVLAPSSSPPDDEWVRVVGRPLRVSYNRSIAPIGPGPVSARRVRAALEAFAPDVVHGHEPFAPSTAMFAVNAGVAPTVATFHAYVPRSRLLRAGRPLLLRTWRRLDVRLAVSEAARDFVQGVFHGAVRVVPNGADVDAFRDAAPAPGLPGGRRVLFVNRLDRRKGFPDAVRAFARLAESVPDAVLVVAGDGPDRPAVNELEPEVRERVVMLGNVPHDRLPPYHAASDVFVAPALGGESFGIVLVEAMAAGLPVVASDIPGYREVVRHGRDGVLVPPGDPAALAAAVARLLEDPAAARDLTSEARARAERYAWGHVAEEIVGCYEQAIRVGRVKG